MSVVTTANGDERAAVVGVRTRGSDQVQWAIWSGDQPVEAGRWVRLSDSGELGRVIVASGMAIGVQNRDSLPAAIEVHSHELTMEADQLAPDQGSWGRIGRYPGSADFGTIDDAESPESWRYRRRKSSMPALGSNTVTVRGPGVVMSSDISTGTMAVRLDDSVDVIEVRRRSSKGSGMPLPASLERPIDSPE